MKDQRLAAMAPGLSSDEQVILLNSILQSSTEYSIVAKDLDATIIAWNEGARRIYGYDPEEVVGKQSAFILHDPDDVATGRAQKILDEARTTGRWSGELKRVRKNGSLFTALVTVTLRQGQDGRPIGFTMISRDLTDTHKLLLDLRESQEYNRGLIESNIDALMTTDPIGVITDVNRQMCEMTGLNREDLVGSPFKRYFTDPKRAEDGIRQTLAQDRVTNYELVMRARDGHETVVSYNATTFRGADSRLRGVFAAARDITEHKRLEEELRQAQNYTRGLIEASVDALLTVDPDLQITDVNQQTERITGYTREELIGSRFPDYFTEPDRAEAGVRQTLAENVVTNYVLALRSRAGTETLVSFNASVFRDPDGQVRGIFAAARDITDQKRLEEDLRQAQHYTRGLIESSVDPMVTVDPDLMITDVNEQMVKLTGTPKEALVGSRFDRYFTEPDRAASGVRQTLREQFVTNYELTLQTADGRHVLVSFNASIFRDAAGEVRGVFAVARDVTAQRRLEEQLREQQNYSRSLIEASVDALVTVDPGGIITDVNEQMSRLTGAARRQLVGSQFASYFTEPERASAGVRQTFDQGVVTNYELALRNRAGRVATVSFNAAVFRDTAGRVAGIFAAARDISAQKQIEQELREQQVYTRGLIESNIDALVTIDPLGVVTDVNRQMCELTGAPREALVGSRFKDYFTDPARAEDGVRQTLAQDRVTNYELTIRAADGRETVVSYNATTFAGEDGRLKGVFAAARDITAQKRLEAELRQTQHYNRGLIESSVDAMLTVDPALTITDVNEQMVKLAGYRRDDLIGSAFQDYFTEPDRATAGVRRTLEQGFVTNYELLLRSRHRREILVSFNASVFKDVGGAVRGIFAVARDVTEQRRLEEKLRESENYNRGLIESSVDALVTVDPDLAITDVNEQMVQLTGYGRDELIGSAFKDYFTEPDRAGAGVRQTFAQGSVTNYELVLKNRSGRRTVVSFNAGTFKDTDGRVAGILAAARDITAQKRLEEELREQQKYNRSLIESSVDALMTVDPLGVITDVNEQTVRLFGHIRRQLVGSPFAEYFTDPTRARAGVAQTFTDESVTNYELTLRTKTGRKIPVSFNAAVFRDTAGQVAGILAGARDTSDQKRVEQELREQQTYARGLVESNIDALMTTDTIGVISDVNRQMEMVTGRTREELVGTPFKDYFTNPQRAEDGIRRVLTDGKVTNYELTLRATDGRETVVSYNATTFTGEDGRLRGVFAAARDITDQKRLEEQLRRNNEELGEQNRRVQEANRLKSEFLANMSHELRTPLNSIIGFAELMHDGRVGPVADTHKEYLGDILTSSRHLLQLINDVLDLSKVESGKMEFRPEPLDLPTVAGEVRDILRAIAAKKRIAFAIKADPGIGTVSLDAGKLKQVLYNYLSNAIKFTADEGRVTLRFRKESPETFRLEVEDTGIGIRPDDVPRLFREFEQLDASTAKKYPGTGLGLALTKRIVEAQGGHVGVQSTPGAGSTFFAVLPLTTPASLAQSTTGAPPSHTAAVHAGASVLVVEDEPDDRRWLAATLVEAGYLVKVADTVAAAKALLERQEYDVVMLDLVMPDGSGWEVATAMREPRSLNINTPIVVVTVTPEAKGPTGLLLNEVLAKPVSEPALLAAIRRAARPAGASRTVLVVDDDKPTLRLVRELIRSVGLEPVCVATGKRGLAVARKNHLAAVVLDLAMDRMDGFEFLRRFRNDLGNRHTPVIVYTGIEVDEQQRGQLASAAAILSKTPSGVSLIEEVRAVVGMRRESPTA